MAALLILLATGACFGSYASAKTLTAKVRVSLRVRKVCTVHAPGPVRMGATGVPIISPSAFLSDCTSDEIPAVALRVLPDPTEKGTDVATINF
jgi:hypothetical protein